MTANKSILCAASALPQHTVLRSHVLIPYIVQRPPSRNQLCKARSYDQNTKNCSRSCQLQCVAPASRSKREAERADMHLLPFANSRMGLKPFLMCSGKEEISTLDTVCCEPHNLRWLFSFMHNLRGPRPQLDGINRFASGIGPRWLNFGIHNSII